MLKSIFKTKTKAHNLERAFSPRLKFKPVGENMVVANRLAILHRPELACSHQESKSGLRVISKCAAPVRVPRAQQIPCGRTPSLYARLGQLQATVWGEGWEEALMHREGRSNYWGWSTDSCL